ncbi:helix-turn-helix domain-containing protein [Paenibacillus guangzhouensis]|uniref:helix-turn-helix domain-containing protein n=1 Tax=Paenibacillus guangzhouensis TaxID=1473112 RepID=UPI00187B1C4E|nr:helix-turn-helix domain-containing protein [Paenibacillus guangzhouensis]
MYTVETVQRAIDYIEEHLVESLELEQIAEAAVMSVPNLYRMFYAIVGHPIKEYIRKRRISEAACLLRHTNLTTIDIGFRCGFDTYQTFIKSFKRNTGLTPGLYRRAEFIYSFERISLIERVTYLEEREISERFPSIKVIRLAPMMGIGYLYSASSEDGLEESSLSEFRANLSKLDISQMRLFGWNVNLEGANPYGYQMVAVSEKVYPAEHQGIQPFRLMGGLYAVTSIPKGSGSEIVAAWNRLLSEWLPLSTFELGEHGFLEEYQQCNSQIVRLKLYLPVKRRQKTETIQIMVRPSVRVVSFRAQGVDCVARADEASLDWLARNEFVGDKRLQVFMSCSYGMPTNECDTYEVYIAPPEDFMLSQENENQITSLEGGLYACLTTGAYGSMSGVLERIYRWLVTSPDYELDRERSWYAHYIPPDSGEDGEGLSETDMEWAVTVMCFVPINLLKIKMEDGP